MNHNAGTDAENAAKAEQAEALGERATVVARNHYEKVHELASDALQETLESIRRKPFAAAGIGFGLGFVLGVLLRPR